MLAPHHLVLTLKYQQKIPFVNYQRVAVNVCKFTDTCLTAKPNAETPFTAILHASVKSIFTDPLYCADI